MKQILIFSLSVILVATSSWAQIDLSSEDTIAENYVFPVHFDCQDVIGRKNRKDCSNDKMMEFINKHVKYPFIAEELGISGQVVVQFTIDINGKIQNPIITKGIGGGCDEEVLRVINKMRRKSKAWTPGKQYGETVAVIISLPINFYLNTEK